MTPVQMAAAFAAAQGAAGGVKHSSPPAWLFWIFSRHAAGAGGGVWGSIRATRRVCPPRAAAAAPHSRLPRLSPLPIPTPTLTPTPTPPLQPTPNPPPQGPLPHRHLPAHHRLRRRRRRLPRVLPRAAHLPAIPRGHGVGRRGTHVRGRDPVRARWRGRGARGDGARRGGRQGVRRPRSRGAALPSAARRPSRAAAVEVGQPRPTGTSLSRGPAIFWCLVPAASPSARRRTFCSSIPAFNQTLQ
jgi:hypothetical protein